MADPDPYSQEYNFSSNPTDPLPGTRIDIELANVQTASQEAVDAIKDIRRADGALQNNIVGPDALAPSLSIGFTLRGSWVEGETYNAGDGVTLGTSFYKARVQNLATADNGPEDDPDTWAFLLTFATITITDGSITPPKLDAAQAAGFLAVLGLDDQGALTATAIAAAPDKAAPIDTDLLGLVDSAASNALKSLTWANAKAAVFSALGGLISGGTAKTAPIDTDTFALSDSEDANSTKKLTWASFKATLKTYFDTLYLAASALTDYTQTATTGQWAGQIFGLQLSNNSTDATNDINLAAGSARDFADTDFLKLVATMTKRLDAAWAAGTNQGGRMSAAAIANTTYHCFLIKNPTTGVVDWGFDTSATSPSLPTGFTKFRFVGSVVRSGGVLRSFIQDGDKFRWNTSSPPLDLSITTNRSKAALTLTLPTGRRVEALLQATLDNISGVSTPTVLSVYDGANTSIVATATCSSNNNDLVIAPVFLSQFTNTSAQVQCALNIGVSGGVDMNTLGWIDRRGQ